MRAHDDKLFTKYLLRLGNGTKETNEVMPEDICLPSTGEIAGIEKVIDHVFPALDHNIANLGYMTSRAILSAKKENIYVINVYMIGFADGGEDLP
jgi:hypothetical protein